MKPHPPKARARAARLRADGLTYRQIAERLDVTMTTVFRWLNPDYAERARMRSRRAKAARRTPCVRCGQPKAYDRPDNDLCRRCLADDEHQAARERIIEAMRDWHSRYGESPSATDWNRAPSMYARLGRARRAEVERRLRDRPWPHATSVQQLFGSWSAALAEAGLESRPIGRPKAATA